MIYTCGHSNLTADQYADTIKKYGITLVIDVRSSPASKYVPWVNKGIVGYELRQRGINYLAAGRVLGGYANYTVEDPLFLEKIARVVKLGEGENVVLMCSEKNPEGCHRAYKLCSTIHRVYPDVKMTHIIGNTTVDTREFEIERPFSFVSDYQKSHLTDLW